MVRLRDSRPTSLPVAQQPRNPQPESIARKPYEVHQASDYLELAADIVSVFVSNNSVPVAELPALIGNVHAALTPVAHGAAEEPKEELCGQQFRSRSQFS